MQSVLPSGPKPTKETYLANLRVLKEQHISLDEPMRSPASKSFKNRILLCSEDIIHPCNPETTHLESKPISNHTAAMKLGQKTVNMAEETVTQSPSKSVKISDGGPGGASKKMNPPAESHMVTRFGRKATLRFQMVSKKMPKYHFDLALKQRVATELKSMNCWSDDEDYESSKIDRSKSGDDSEESDSDGSYGFEEKPPKQGKPAASEKLKVNIPTTPGGGALTEQLSPTAKSIKNVGFHGASTKDGAPGSSPKANKSGKSSKGPHAYLEEQKIKQRNEARERVIKKVVKLILKMRKDEEDAFKKRQLEGQSKLTPQQKLAIQKIAAMRVNRMIVRGLSMAVEARVKADRRERRRVARNLRAYQIIATAYRKFRVRYLLGCVIDFIRQKAARFREQQIREEREFRMRTAMRRVREDSAMKDWCDEQTRTPTFPVKPTAPGALRVDTFLQSIQKETITTLRKSRYIFNLGTSTQDKEALAKAAAEKAEKAKKASPVPAPAPVVANTAPQVVDPAASSELFLTETRSAESTRAAAAPAPAPAAKHNKKPTVVKAAPKTAEQLHYDYHRPDLAPFSTHINNMIARSALFQLKAEPNWVDVASVGADYLASFKGRKKSPAYIALEKFCGISQEEVVRSKLMSHKEGVDMKLKSFGHSIVSL